MASSELDATVVKDDADAAAPAPIDDGVPIIATFEAFYLAQYASMVRLAHVLVDTVEQAEEVAQEAFATVYTRWRRLDNPGGYLRVCVINGARKHLRRRRVSRRQPPPEAGVTEGVGFNHLIDQVRRLPARQRAVVVLRFELQLSDADIASTLGIPVGTVKSTLHRALARLRQEIEQ